jgi:hypothetical protein
MLAALNTYAQDKYPGLAKKISNNVVDDYDSVILLFYLPFYGHASSIKLSGYGIKNYSVTKIKMEMYLQNGIAPPFDSESNKVENKNVRDAIKNIALSSIFKFNQDSLNLTCVNPADTMYYVNGHDAAGPAYYGLFVAGGDGYIAKLCYNPERYQIICPTKDRAVFMAIIDKVEDLLKK